MKPTIVPEETRRKGITLALRDCNNRIMHSAMDKLDNKAEVFTGKDLSRWMKIKNTYDRKSKLTQKVFQTLLKKHAIHDIVKDDKGETILLKNGNPKTTPRMLPTGRGTMDFDFKDETAFHKEYEEAMDEEFKIESFCLLTEDLAKAGLTPKEIRSCAKILSDIDPEILEVDKPEEDEDDETMPDHIALEEDEPEEDAEGPDEASEPLAAKEDIPHAPTPSRPSGAHASI